MKMGHAENQVEKYLVDHCADNGFLCYKYVATSRRGIPDRIVIGNGYTIFVETKSPVGELSKQQIFRIKEMEAAGANVRVCYTRTQCDILINEIKTGKFKLNKSCLPVKIKGGRKNA